MSSLHRDQLGGTENRPYGGGSGGLSLSPLPDFLDEVDSFTGLELYPMNDELVILPFPKYGFWWFLELDGALEIVATHGPYKDEETAIAAGMNLVE